MTSGPVFHPYDVVRCPKCKEHKFWLELKAHNLFGHICEFCFDDYFCQKHDEEWRLVDDAQVCPECAEEYQKDHKEVANA